LKTVVLVCSSSHSVSSEEYHQPNFLKSDVLMTSQWHHC